MDELFPSGVSREGSWKGSCLKTGLMRSGKMLFPDGEMEDERRGDNEGREELAAGLVLAGAWLVGGGLDSCHSMSHGVILG